MRLKQLHYGWLMVIMSVFILAAHAIMFYSFGVFLRPLTLEFNWERGALSGAASVAILLTGLFSIISGRLTDRYGPRVSITVNGLVVGIGFLLMSLVSSLWQVYLIWGLFMGIGGGFCYIPVNSTLPRWFTKKSGMAIGIAVTGIGLGGIISPVLAQWLISASGWQRAFTILGLITFVIIVPLAQFMKHSPQRAGLRPYGEDEAAKSGPPLARGGLSFTQAVRSRRFWAWGIILFCFFFCIQVVIIHIVPHVVDIGIPPIAAASIASVVAGASIAGRLIVGFISDRVRGRLLLIICAFLAGISFLWLLVAREVWMLYIFAVIFGVGYGGMVLLQTIISAELFGLDSLGSILAAAIFCGTVGGALGPPLAGGIFDARGDYRLAFLICLLVCVVAIILSLILLKARSWHND